VDVAGGVSESVLEVLVWSGGRARASAVSRRASSRVLVGLVVRFEASGDVLGSGVEKVEGSILPMNVQRFLFGVLDGDGASAVSFGAVMSAAVSSLESVASEEWRL
jgi:hypothetical protein